MTKSCGCLQRERAAAINRRHDLSATSEYRIWQGAKSRCHNPRNGSYSDYGGRGIFMCDEWRKDPVAFVAFMGRRPSPAHTLDRIDNDGPYAPGNVRWAIPPEQANNKRNNVVMGGSSLARAAVNAGLRYETLKSRRLKGWTEKEALTAPLRRNLREYRGERRSLLELARSKGISLQAVRSRLRKGWTLEKALETPVKYTRTASKNGIQ